jgi:hypothetical protein
VLLEVNEKLQERINNKLAIPKLDFDIDEEDVEKRYSDLIKWFIDKLPSKIKINNEIVNQFKIPLNICKDMLNKNNNHVYPKMDLQIYLKRRNINIWAGYDNCNEVEVYYSFII